VDLPIPEFPLPGDNGFVGFSNQGSVLDRDQLREVTFDDEVLMREIVAALIDDTRRQMLLLDAAIREQDAVRCMRLAHYSKGACANVGAQSAATVLKEIENRASNRNFPECQAALNRLAEQVDLLYSEAAAL
jgi:HPt (histidine-containing phosphotransfer) domain-containing protein